MRVGRFIAWLLLSIGVGFLAWAVIGYFQAGKFEPELLGAVWEKLFPGSLNALEVGIQRHLDAPWLWTDIVLPVVTAPAYVDFLVLGAVLALLFRRRRGKAK